MTDDRSLRSMHARIAALTRAARTDGSEISAPARRAFLAKFETRHECKLCGVVEIDQALPPAQRERAIAAAMSAHFTRLAVRPRAARARARRAYRAAKVYEAELDTELADLDSAAS